MDVVVGLFVNFPKVKAYRNAVGVARKHVVNWLELCFSAYLGRGGVFRSRVGGVIACDAKKLLKQLVRMENLWNHYGDVLKPVGFEDETVIIPDYFGRDFRFPLRGMSVDAPSAFLKYYPFDVAGETVLDIGAYLGDTPLMWLYRGAKSVIAVEPEPLSFKYLKRNVEGLPVTCLNASIGHDMLNVPLVQLSELVERYGTSVVKLDCEGCEHYVLEQLSQIPRLGVKKIAVEFHDFRGYDAYASLAFLRDKLGEYYKTWEKTGTSISGRALKFVTVYWLL